LSNSRNKNSVNDLHAPVRQPEPPTCEIVTIGTELLLGQILDTNTSYLAKEMGRAGVAVRFRTAVGDYLEEIERVLRYAAGRCDMVITTGGLGPTEDDLTREAVARSAGVDLEFMQDLMDWIEAVFSRAGYHMSENNRRQAFVPRGATPVHNAMGTAPGFIKEVEGKPVICLPGVPRELKFMIEKEILPWVRERFNLARSTLTYRVLKTAGIGESKVDRIIGDLMTAGANPEVGLLASMGEIRIRIAARGRDEPEALAVIEPVAAEIRSRLGKKIYGENEDTLEGVIHALLEQRGLDLALFESFTGGVMAQRLHAMNAGRLLESRVNGKRAGVARYMENGGTGNDEKDALLMARSIRDMCGAGAGLALLGFPEKEGKGFRVRAHAAAAVKGMEKVFSWVMGGDMPTLRNRGAVTGLNTLRLALLEFEGA
jgi:competence/damage-inducible protein CinA-like protein